MGTKVVTVLLIAPVNIKQPTLGGFLFLFLMLPRYEDDQLVSFDRQFLSENIIQFSPYIEIFSSDPTFLFILQILYIVGTELRHLEQYLVAYLEAKDLPLTYF